MLDKFIILLMFSVNFNIFYENNKFPDLPDLPTIAHNYLQ